MDDDELMTTREVAEHFGVPVSTVYRWRYVGNAPEGFRIGRHLRFRSSAVNAWMSAKETQEEQRHDNNKTTPTRPNQRGATQSRWSMP